MAATMVRDVREMHCANCHVQIDTNWTWWTRGRRDFCSIACFMDRLEVSA